MHYYLLISSLISLCFNHCEQLGDKLHMHQEMSAGVLFLVKYFRLMDQ